MVATTMWTRGRVWERSPLPSLVTMMEDPVSATRKLAPVMPNRLRELLAQNGTGFRDKAFRCLAVDGGAQVCVVERKSASTSASVRWMAGAMIWLGASPRFWMMYSPMSLQGLPCPHLKMGVQAYLLRHHRLALTTRRAFAARQMPAMVFSRLGGIHAQWTREPSSIACLEGFQMRGEIVERAVADGAGFLAHGFEFGKVATAARRWATRPPGSLARAACRRSSASAAAALSRKVAGWRSPCLNRGVADRGIGEFAGENFGNVAAGQAALAGQLARDMHEAAEIAGEEKLRVGADGRVGLAGHDRVRDISILFRRRGRRSRSRLGILHLVEFEARHFFQGAACGLI